MTSARTSSSWPWATSILPPGSSRACGWWTLKSCEARLPKSPALRSGLSRISRKPIQVWPSSSEIPTWHASRLVKTSSQRPFFAVSGMGSSERSISGNGVVLHHIRPSFSSRIVGSTHQFSHRGPWCGGLISNAGPGGSVVLAHVSPSSSERNTVIRYGYSPWAANSTRGRDWRKYGGRTMIKRRSSTFCTVYCPSGPSVDR